MCQIYSKLTITIHREVAESYLLYDIAILASRTAIERGKNHKRLVNILEFYLVMCLWCVYVVIDLFLGYIYTEHIH